MLPFPFAPRSGEAEPGFHQHSKEAAGGLTQTIGRVQFQPPAGKKKITNKPTMFTAFASHRSIALLPLADKPCQLLPSSHPGDRELFPVRGRPAQWANTALARQLGAEETRWSGPGRSVCSPHSFCVNTKRDWADSSLVWSTKTVGCLARSQREIKQCYL